ncbi:MAG TPA: NAD-binding protein [Candidatus Dormibacteraeota bacterium]|nr:NAD-binding protein [Candidatus Dormibacteraeota bacterium]
MSDYIRVNPTVTRSKRQTRKLGFILYAALYGPIVLIRTVWRQSLVLSAMFLSGGIVFHYYEHLPALDAFLASVSTITTIGLYVPNGGNFVTLNRQEAFLLIVMIIVSVGAGASILQNTVNSVVNGGLAKGEIEKKLIAKLNGHFIVYGYSRMGKYVVEKLDESGLDYVVITKAPNVYNDLIGSDVLAVLETEGDAIKTLKSAHIENASVVVASDVNDSDNLLLILSARKLRHDIKIITIVHEPSLMEMAKNAGADLVVPSSITLGHLLAFAAVTPDAVGLINSEKIGRMGIAEFPVASSSHLVGAKLQYAAKLATIAGVERNGVIVQNIFDGDFTLREGDILLVIGDPSSLMAFKQEESH